MKQQIILIVDDDKMILKSILRILRNEDYQILTAQSGQEGLTILKDYEVNLVISDQQMPGMNGLEFLKRTKKEYPQVLAIMLTGHAEVEKGSSLL